ARHLPSNSGLPLAATPLVGQRLQHRLRASSYLMLSIPASLHPSKCASAAAASAADSGCTGCSRGFFTGTLLSIVSFSMRAEILGAELTSGSDLQL
ncbi:hypothetical protein PENTCL1PPCAC_19810, partial [Pristionchus entomophagus]